MGCAKLRSLDGLDNIQYLFHRSSIGGKKIKNLFTFLSSNNQAKKTDSN